MRIINRKHKFCYSIIEEYNIGREHFPEHWRNWSGSMILLDDGEKIQDGFIAKTKHGDVAGWTVLFENEQCHIYIRPEYRKIGLGAKLIEKMVKKHPRAIYCPWNSYTKNFFLKKGVTITKTYL